MRHQIPVGVFGQVVLQQRDRGEDRQLSVAIVQDHVAQFAALAGAIDEEKVVLESLGSIKRAGADLIFSYFALDLAEKKILR